MNQAKEDADKIRRQGEDKLAAKQSEIADMENRLKVEQEKLDQKMKEA